MCENMCEKLREKERERETERKREESVKKRENANLFVGYEERKERALSVHSSGKCRESERVPTEKERQEQHRKTG